MSTRRKNLNLKLLNSSGNIGLVSHVALAEELVMGFHISCSWFNITVQMLLMDVDKTYRGKARREQHKNAVSCIEQILEATAH